MMGAPLVSQVNLTNPLEGTTVSHYGAKLAEAPGGQVAYPISQSYKVAKER